MRVFVTGSTGFVGTAVVNELLSHGHTVLGLTRSDKGAAQLAKQGASPLRGTLDDLDTLRRGASQCDAVIHLAFEHDFANFAACCAKDRAAIAAMGEALAAAASSCAADKDKPPQPAPALVTTTGTMLLKLGEVAREASPADTASPFGALRSGAESLTLSFAARGVRASVVRLAPTTHGRGWSGFTGVLAQMAMDKGVSACVGDGRNRWGACHVADAARLYRLAAERGAPGSVYHGVAQGGVAVGDIAARIGEVLGLPVGSVAPDRAEEHFGWFAGPAAADNPSSSERTQEELGWTPSGGGVLESVQATVDCVRARAAEKAGSY